MYSSAFNHDKSVSQSVIDDQLFASGRPTVFQKNGIALLCFGSASHQKLLQSHWKSISLAIQAL